MCARCILDDGHGRRVRGGLGGGGVLCGLEPVPDADGDGARGLDGVRGEEGAARGGGDARERGEAPDGDEDGGEGRHHLGVLRGEEVERVAGVQQPEGRVRLGRGHCGNTIVSLDREPAVLGAG